MTTKTETTRSTRARITAHGILTEDGQSYDLLGSGTRYGFDSVYAIRKTGEVAATPIPANVLPSPYGDDEIEF